MKRLDLYPTWVLLYPRGAENRTDRIGEPLTLSGDQPPPVTWTDDYSSL